MKSIGKRPQVRANLGLSLVELMVAMALGLVIMATIGTAYVGAQKAFASQNALGMIQEDARTAFELLGTEIRMTGFNGGPTDIDPTQPTGWSGLKDLQNYPLVGYQEGVSTFPSFSVSYPRLRGDAVTVIHADVDEEYALATTPPNPSGSGTYVYTLATWPSTAPQAGGVFVAADYTHAAAFTVTSVNAGSKTLTTSDAPGTFSGDLAARYVYPLNGATFYISTNAAGEPALYRYKLGSNGGSSAEELVEGVYDMQITYGVDYSAPASATGISTATWTSLLATFTSAGHGLHLDDWVTVSGVSPSTYNGYYRVVNADTDTFTVSLTSNPGTYTSGGTALRAIDLSVDDYWTADLVDAGTDGTNSFPGPATGKNYWSHVLSVRFELTLTSRQNQKVSTTQQPLQKTYTTTIAVRNRL